MNWRIDFSRDSLRFLENNNLKEDFVVDKIKLVLRKFKGEDIGVNIKKLKGEWEGFYRVRFGKLRIIIEFHFEYCQVYIDKIDWRGNAYK